MRIDQLVRASTRQLIHEMTMDVIRSMDDNPETWKFGVTGHAVFHKGVAVWIAGLDTHIWQPAEINPSILDSFRLWRAVRRLAARKVRLGL